jgi:hypothetical protein
MTFFLLNFGHRGLYDVLKSLHMATGNFLFCLIAQSICDTLLVYTHYLFVWNFL